MVEELADLWALKRLAESYAYAVDQGDEALMASLFTDDGVIEGAGRQFSGADEINSLLRGLRANYLKTFHLVGNQTSSISGDTAEGVTYCVAKHLFKDAGKTLCHEMTIRYHDQFRRTDEGWRFARRNVAIEWTETYPVEAD